MRAQSERRRTPRKASRFPLRFRLIPVDAGGYLDAHVEDLSADGLRFRCASRVREHASLLISMLIPGAEPVRSFGQAAWVRELPGSEGFEVGGRFVDQSTAARMALEQHLQYAPLAPAP